MGTAGLPARVCQWWCQSAPIFRCGRRNMTAPTPKNRSPDAAPRPERLRWLNQRRAESRCDVCPAEATPSPNRAEDLVGSDPAQTTAIHRCAGYGPATRSTRLRFHDSAQLSRLGSAFTTRLRFHDSAPEHGGAESMTLAPSRES